MTDTLQAQGEFAPAESSLPLKPWLLPWWLMRLLTQSLPSLTAFIELGLAPELVQAVADLGYTQPTSVQRKAIPLAMALAMIPPASSI